MNVLPFNGKYSSTCILKTCKLKNKHKCTICFIIQYESTALSHVKHCFQTCMCITVWLVAVAPWVRHHTFWHFPRAMNSVIPGNILHKWRSFKDPVLGWIPSCTSEPKLTIRIFRLTVLNVFFYSTRHFLKTWCLICRILSR